MTWRWSTLHLCGCIWLLAELLASFRLRVRQADEVAVHQLARPPHLPKRTETFVMHRCNAPAKRLPEFVGNARVIQQICIPGSGIEHEPAPRRHITEPLDNAAADRWLGRLTLHIGPSITKGIETLQRVRDASQWGKKPNRVR